MQWHARLAIPNILSDQVVGDCIWPLLEFGRENTRSHLERGPGWKRPRKSRRCRQYRGLPHQCPSADHSAQVSTPSSIFPLASVFHHLSPWPNVFDGTVESDLRCVPLLCLVLLRRHARNAPQNVPTYGENRSAMGDLFVDRRDCRPVAERLTEGVVRHGRRRIQVRYRCRGVLMVHITIDVQGNRLLMDEAAFHAIV